MSSEPDRMLVWKVRAFTLGAGMALTGIYFEQPWLTGTAIVILLAGAFLRFQLGADSGQGNESDATEADDDLEG